MINLDTPCEWMVGEMGMSALGEISRLSRAFEPDVATITLIALEHLEFLGSLDGIARANAEILDGLRPGGVFVLNADDPRIAARDAPGPDAAVWQARRKPTSRSKASSPTSAARSSA